MLESRELAELFKNSVVMNNGNIGQIKRDTVICLLVCNQYSQSTEPSVR